MAIDEELLKPSRQHLAHLDILIAKAEREMVEAIERWGKDDKEYARRRSEEFYMAVEPLRRERDGVAKIISDYYALRAQLPPIIVAAVTTDRPDTQPNTSGPISECRERSPVR
jgi:hypothetical protein